MQDVWTSMLLTGLIVSVVVCGWLSFSNRESDKNKDVLFAGTMLMIFFLLPFNETSRHLLVEIENILHDNNRDWPSVFLNMSYYGSLAIASCAGNFLRYIFRDRNSTLQNK